MVWEPDVLNDNEGLRGPGACPTTGSPEAALGWQMTLPWLHQPLPQGSLTSPQLKKGRGPAPMSCLPRVTKHHQAVEVTSCGEQALGSCGILDRGVALRMLLL